MIDCIKKPFEGDIEHPFSFELDDFQKHAIHILNQETICNILVTAQTGSGKSLVAEYAIIRSQTLHKKIIYCSPIKTLSNQKYYEFSKKYPSVGIITGDNKHNPMADCLIMTTEILLLMLQKVKISSIDYHINIQDEVYAIIFDEVHYINDHERGHVWEKCIIMIPNHISIIMLSATISNPVEFLEWVHSCNENKSYLLSNEKRIVPLKFNYTVHLQKIPKQIQKMEDKLFELNPIMETNQKKIDQDAIHEFLFFNKFSRSTSYGTNTKWLIQNICKKLFENEMCPALFFVFSKKSCDYFANSMTIRFNTEEEGRQIEKDIIYYLSKFENNQEYKKTLQYYQILDLAKKGIAIHHSGLIPVFKEIIELLFSKNYIKILFATETFSVGLNMPTKTVVFTDIFKFDHNGKRILHAHEFIQMCGRAGRRGLDTIGYVILLPQLISEIIERHHIMTLLQGKPQTISSKLRIDEKMILDSAFYEKNEFFQKTMFHKEIEEEKNQIQKNLDTLPRFDIKNFELLDEYERIHSRLNDIIQSSKSMKKELMKRKVEIEKLPEFDYIRSYRNYYKTIKDCLRDKEYMDHYVDFEMDKKFTFLKNESYIDENNNLTEKGKVSLFFKELNPLIGSEIVFKNDLDLDEKEYLTLLIIITPCGGSQNVDDFFEIPYENVIKFIRFLESKVEFIINRRDIYPILDWYDHKHITDIVKEYKIFEGDLIKTIHRLINILDELKEAYLYRNNLSIINQLETIKNALQRDIVTTDSLYLHL